MECMGDPPRGSPNETGFISIVQSYASHPKYAEIHLDIIHSITGTTTEAEATPLMCKCDANPCTDSISRVDLNQTILLLEQQNVCICVPVSVSGLSLQINPL